MDKTKNPDYRPCENCGKMIRPGRDGRRKFCNQACKQSAWRKRKVTVTDTVSVK